MRDRDDMPRPEGANMADKSAQYQSPPDSIALARATMRDVKAALTRGTDGEFPAKYAGVDWDGMNMQPPNTAWQDMDLEQRYDLLRHVLDESIWSLEPSANRDEPGDSQKLALEFVKDEERQLHAEMRHDYGLRFLEDRGVKYEDTAERPLDHAGSAGRGDKPHGHLVSGIVPVTSPGRASQPPHPWPSEIANQNRHQPGNDHGNGHQNDNGNSM